jgi:hypothetical protein
VLLELVNLGLKVVDDVVSVCERYSMVLHLLLKLFYLLLYTLDLQVLCGLELLKLTGLNLGGLLNHMQKGHGAEVTLGRAQTSDGDCSKVPLPCHEGDSPSP